MKVWDLATASCAFSHALTDSIVDTLRWDLASESVLFSASDDGAIRVSDIRVSKEVAACKFEAKIEHFSLDPFSPTELALSFDNGSVSGLDLRQGFKPLFSSHVSGKAVTSVSHNALVKGMLCTTSLDGTMSVFNANLRDQDQRPKFVCREFANMVRSGHAGPPLRRAVQPRPPAAFRLRQQQGRAGGLGDGRQPAHPRILRPQGLTPTCH